MNHWQWSKTTHGYDRKVHSRDLPLPLPLALNDQNIASLWFSKTTISCVYRTSQFKVPLYSVSILSCKSWICSATKNDLVKHGHLAECTNLKWVWRWCFVWLWTQCMIVWVIRTRAFGKWMCPVVRKWRLLEIANHRAHAVDLPPGEHLRSTRRRSFFRFAPRQKMLHSKNEETSRWVDLATRCTSTACWYSTLSLSLSSRDGSFVGDNRWSTCSSNFWPV